VGRSPLLLIASAALLAACDSDLPVASFIDKLRVLAVRAEPAEVMPDGVTELTALAVEPSHLPAAAAPLSFLWLACRVPPGVASPLPCGLNPGELDGTVLPPACGEPFDGDLCVLSSDGKAELQPAASLFGDTRIGQVLVTLVVADTGAGAAACLLETARNGGLPVEADRCVISIKRVAVRDPAVPTEEGPRPNNHNPRLDRLDLMDADGTLRSLTRPGAAVPADDGAIERRLSTLRASEAAEQKPDGSYEALSISWFTTAGSIQGGRSSFDPPGCETQEECATRLPELEAETRWESPAPERLAAQVDASGRVRLWAVVRDDRGGVGWIEGSLIVR
jgi:hypothetical protein